MREPIKKGSLLADPLLDLLVGIEGEKGDRDDSVHGTALNECAPVHRKAGWFWLGERAGSSSPSSEFSSESKAGSHEIMNATVTQPIAAATICEIRVRSVIA